MARKKVKKAKAKLKVKKARAEKKQRQISGQKIKVREIIEPKSENIYGSVLEQNKAEAENIITPEFAWADFDFYEKEPSVDLDETAGLEQEVNYNNEAEEFILADYGQAQELDNQEKFREPEPMENLSSRQKMVIMYICLVCVMTAIIGFWFLNMKASLSQNLKNVNWKIKNDGQIGQSLDEFSQGISDLKTQLEERQNTINNFTEQARAKIIEQQLKNSVTEKMKEKLQNLNINSTNTNSP